MPSTGALIHVARWTVLAAALGVVGGACAVAISSIISTVEKAVGNEPLVIPAFMLLAGSLAALHPELRGTGMEIIVRGSQTSPRIPSEGWRSWYSRVSSSAGEVVAVK